MLNFKDVRPSKDYSFAYKWVWPLKERSIILYTCKYDITSFVMYIKEYSLFRNAGISYTIIQFGNLLDWVSRNENIISKLCGLMYLNNCSLRCFLRVFGWPKYFFPRKERQSKEKAAKCEKCGGEKKGETEIVTAVRRHTTGHKGIYP